MTCPYCQTRPVAPSTRGGRPPVTCMAAVCRRAMKAASNRAASRRYEASRRSESESSVEARFQQARAARLARERATGVREHTIGDGWQQRGERRYVAAEGEGW